MEIKIPKIETMPLFSRGEYLDIDRTEGLYLKITEDMKKRLTSQSKKNKIPISRLSFEIIYNYLYNN